MFPGEVVSSDFAIDVLTRKKSLVYSVMQFCGTYHLVLRGTDGSATIAQPRIKMVRKKTTGVLECVENVLFVNSTQNSCAPS
jgi:hypothetical protein